ncbi:MAG: hypothetical protein P1U70_12150 [Saprospiraceae bacterium]|jgi:tRNA(His) 5'-end guanylyltransferase|nr:hypothetical protein [Saprospiraceae bacterium]
MKKIILSIITTLLFTAQTFAQTKHFQGTWTKLETTYVFEFDLYINHIDDKNVEGYFDWKVTSPDEKNIFSTTHYNERLGSTAREYFRGIYMPKSKNYMLFGHKKEDPNMIIAPDDYRLKIDENGDISGRTKAHNTWKGRINGKRVVGEQV